jgi:Big-like domain-containing protein
VRANAGADVPVKMTMDAGGGLRDGSQPSRTACTQPRWRSRARTKIASRQTKRREAAFNAVEIMMSKDVGQTELFRFRTVRPVTHKEASATAFVIRGDEPPAVDSVPSFQAILVNYPWVLQLSTSLSSQGDYVSPPALLALLPNQWTLQVGPPTPSGWTNLGNRLTTAVYQLAIMARAIPPVSGAFGVSVVPPSLASQTEEACRLVLVYDLLNTLANDQTVAPSERTLQSAQDVQNALAFRSVLLPKASFTCTPPVLARQPGVTDLSIVRDEWNRYVAGEIANVINVLPNETLDARTGHMEETVNTTSSSSEQTTTQTTTNSQTTSQTLSQAATTTASTTIGAQAQVDVSGGFGPMQIKSNIGAQIQTSQSSSQTLSRTTAMQTVASAVKTVSQTVTQAQSTRTTVKDTDSQEHKQQNNTAAPINAPYRWLSVVHRVQLVTYPNRLVLEFEIPEPAAWLRWALTNQPDTPWSNPDPGPFTTDGQPPAITNAITPGGMTASLASALAARWRVQGLSQPPPATQVVGQSYTIQGGSSAEATNPQLNDNSIEIPSGYAAATWVATGEVIGGGDKGGHYTDVWVGVGGTGQQRNVGTQGVVSVVTGDLNFSGTINGLNTGTIPVSINGFYTAGGVCNVVVTCNALTDVNGNNIPLSQWAQITFDQIAAAYNQLLSAFNQERVARAQQEAGPVVVGPPDLNLARTVMELKKLVIQDLLGQVFNPPELVTTQKNYAGVTFHPRDTRASSPVIQFFEQVFEWENIVYICYPYFWGGQGSWLQNATWVSTNPSDPVFDQFLNAGSARVVVPARPGFENLVNYFLYTSQIWGGQNPPGPNDPGYLSIADEIQAIQTGATDGTPVEPPWEITLPTTLLWVGTDTSGLPVNASPTIGPPPSLSVLSQVAIASSSPTSNDGQAVTFSATVSGPSAASAAPTRQVSLLIDGSATADSPLTLDATGKATSAPVVSMTPGVHTVTVTYGGDATYAPGTQTFMQMVDKGGSTATVTSSVNPSAQGAPVAFTVAVAAVAPATGTPTGQVNVLVDEHPTQDSPLGLDSGGTATTAAVTTLGVGTHSIVANYAGDANFAAATSVTLTQTVTGQGKAANSATVSQTIKGQRKAAKAAKAVRS